MREPIKLHCRQVRIGQFPKKINRPRPLNRNLREVVRKILHHALEPRRILPNPVNILLPRPRIDHQQEIALPHPMHNHIVNKRPLRIKQRRILRLPNRQPRRVVHRQMLHRRECLPPRNPYIPHMADVKNPHSRPHRHMLRNNPAVFHRHVPAVEIDHLGAHLSMDRIKRGGADIRHVGRDSGQKDLDQRSGWAAWGMVGTPYPTTRFSTRSNPAPPARNGTRGTPQVTKGTFRLGPPALESFLLC